MLAFGEVLIGPANRRPIVAYFVEMFQPATIVPSCSPPRCEPLPAVGVMPEAGALSLLFMPCNVA